MAALYGEPGVAEVLSVLALNFLVIPFGSITAALLRREMRFASLLRVNLVGALAQGAVSILLALSGSGFMSLAWGGVANALAVTLCTLFYRQPLQPWLPAFTDARRVLRSGGRFSGAALLGEVGYGVSELMTGKVLSLEAVGLLSRAMGTVTLLQRALVEGVYPVAIPLFAAKARSNEALGDLYVRALAYVTVLGWPSLGLLALLARPLIAILFGPQWNASVLPAQILCIGAAAAGSTVISGSVAIALGDAKLVLRAQLVGQPAKIVLAAAGSTLGLAGVAMGLALGEIVFVVYYLSRMRGVLHLHARDFRNAFGQSAIVAVGVVSLSMFIFRILTDGASNSEIVMACATAGAFAWLGMVFVVRHPIRSEIMRVIRCVRSS
jgi:O-antigen/teichoic acid export membrane protein